MKVRYGNLLMTCLFLGLFNVSTFAAVDLESSWQSECRESQLFGTSTYETITFEGENFVKERFLFSDQGCTSSLEGIVRMNGIYGLREDGKISDLDLVYQEMTITVNSKLMANAFDAINFCGVKHWPVGKEIVVADPKGDSCFITSIPEARFGKVELDLTENILFMSSSFSHSPEDRPISVDYDKVFTKQ